MPISGTLSHIDISVGSPDRSIPFYQILLTGLGYKRMSLDLPGFIGPTPQRAGWSIDYSDGGRFGVEVRPADKNKKNRRYDRYEPGPHHMAFHADSRKTVDNVSDSLLNAGFEVLDPPHDYSGQIGYSAGYYAAFFADPDGVKLEAVHLPAE